MIMNMSLNMPLNTKILMTALCLAGSVCASAQTGQDFPKAWKWVGEEELAISSKGSEKDKVLNVGTKDLAEGDFFTEIETQLPFVPEGSSNPTLSPDGSRIAFTRGNDLWVAEVATGKEVRLTDDGSATILNGYASWVYYEEILGRPTRYRAFWWSPDSRKIGFYRFDNAEVPVFPIYSSYPEDYDREKCYELTDEALDRLLTVEGLGSIGILGGDETTIIANDAGAANFNFRHMSLMARTEDENAGSEEIKKILSDMEEAVADMGIDFKISTASSEMDSMMGGSGLSINVSGSDLDELTRISEDLMNIIDSVDGYSDISNGSEDADKVLHLVIDKNKAMSMGLSVAQIYSELADKIDNTADSVTVTMDNIDMMIKVVDNIDPLTRENILDYTFTVDAYDEDDDQITEDHKLSEFATVEINDGISTINRLNQTRYITITASVDEGYNITLLTRELMPMLEAYDMPDGYRLDLGGEYDSVMSMLSQMLLVAGLGLLLIYLVMVAQFQSLLSPFIVLFTIPLAFTGGFLALWLTGSNLSIIGIMGFIVLMGTVVNNGIVFVDYTNQLRIGGMDRHEALIATGKTRMRPILMTALTTILAECKLIFGDDMGAQLGGGMALVIAGGLMYATLMTLFIIPVMYDILFKRQPTNVDIGSEDLEQELDDAGEFIRQNQSAT